ncbi:hypothetical protein NM688_g8446 [Phlebia brevispora]|uniref:Uncharacterized protein n=1 Tax=Phlebia brevispora TaxID=194682 RepID=A0ACC1RRQ5_9APHY|nr:hypothetical protein NM688_g8446 [Phlebia brevispora]
MKSRTVGVLGQGGGQLGRMMAVPAALLDLDIIFLDVGEHTPAKQVFAPKHPDKAHINGSFSDPAMVRELAHKVDVLTVEIEHVNVDMLERVEGIVPLGVHPSPSTIRIIQDKFLQKKHLQSHGCPVSDFMAVEPTAQSIEAAAATFGLPLMLKSKTLAYDGRGNYALRELSQIPDALSALKNRPLYAEKWVQFSVEISVMVVRSTSGEVRSYPVVETVHKDNICHLVFAPLRSHDPRVPERARFIAENAVKSLSGAGVFGVEMFLLSDGKYNISQ